MASRSDQLFWNDATAQLYRDAQLFGLMRLARNGPPALIPVCGDGVCTPGESSINCPADCL